MPGNALIIVSNNPVGIQAGQVTVDRKFHDGFLNYVEQLTAPLLAVNPLSGAGQAVMDPVTLRLADLPYRLLGVALDRRGKPLPSDAARLREAIASSALVCGYGYGSDALSHELHVPFVACLEYDLGTQLDLARMDAPNVMRAAVRMARCVVRYYREVVPAMRAARSVHANGYPMARAAARLNADTLLYLDSRMHAGMVLDAVALERRLAARAGRPLRLVYSGRYERMKGADDAVRVALECLRRGLAVEMDCWGQGALADTMRAEVAAAGRGAQVRVHDAITFPELVTRTREADVFVCCHTQSDPSCTYLESMGSGLPIAGYANRMWQAMHKESGAGAVAARRTPAALADVIAHWIATPDTLAQASRRARDFALQHDFDTEFRRRTDALNRLYAESMAGRM